jgi:hypothetical protein
MKNSIDFDNFDSIYYFENVFTEEQNNKIWNDFLNRGTWEYGHSSNQKSKMKFWYNELINEDFFTNDLFLVIKRMIGNNFEILRCYANGQTSFQDSEMHIDSREDDEYTFLYYPMNNWDVQWGGETVFLLPSGEIEYVLPFPNGAVFFPANWRHYGKSPSFDFPFGLRTTIAYKLKMVN